MELRITRKCAECGSSMVIFESIIGRHRFVCRNSECKKEVSVSLLEECSSYGLLRRFSASF
ncbi:MAG: hypothetical protein WCI45_00960 [Desulfuromonadales bacterium]